MSNLQSMKKLPLKPTVEFDKDKADDSILNILSKACGTDSVHAGK